jgi:hypothetical protein
MRLSGHLFDNVLYYIPGIPSRSDDDSHLPGSGGRLIPDVWRLAVFNGIILRKQQQAV